MPIRIPIPIPTPIPIPIPTPIPTSHLYNKHKLKGYNTFFELLNFTKESQFEDGGLEIPSIDSEFRRASFVF